ncbi:OmpA family protein [Halocola ammonii]
MKRTILMCVLVAGFLSACVPSRKFQEVQTENNQLKAANDQLRSENESIESRLSELESQNETLREEIAALKNDTTVLGTSLRHMRNQYDKINDLNEILSEKSDKLLQESAAENRQLLSELQQTQVELQRKEDRLNQLESELNAKEANLNELSTELKRREQRVNELESLIARKDSAVAALEQKISKALLGFKDKGLTVEQKNGKVYVSLEAKLLFPSGSTAIDQEGKQALIDLAKAIESTEDLEIIVEGHTDTDKIRSSSIPRDNWELSVLRATSVVKIMMENSDIDPKILTAAGKSEYVPVDPSDKAKNRRIEIILSPNLNELFEIIGEKP